MAKLKATWGIVTALAYFVGTIAFAFAAHAAIQIGISLPGYLIVQAFKWVTQ